MNHAYHGSSMVELMLQLSGLELRTTNAYLVEEPGKGLKLIIRVLPHHPRRTDKFYGDCGGAHRE